jgi:hypothetical protein
LIRPFCKKKIFSVLAVLAVLCYGVAFAAAREPVMSAAGKVLEISETFLKMERSAKGETEIMEFVLENPLYNINVGEQLKVSYRQKEKKYVLIRAQKAKKTAIVKPTKKGFERVFDAAAPQTVQPAK